MFGRDHHAKSQRKKKKKDRDGCDVGDCGGGFDCPCDGPCMFSLTFLGLVAVAAPNRAPLARPSAPGRAGMAAIRGYQKWLSPRLPTACRHVPTCSSFGLEAVRRYGLVTGSRLAADRIRRCTHEVPRGTVDPVP